MDLHKFGEIKRIYRTFIVKDREEHINLITKEHEKSMMIITTYQLKFVGNFIYSRINYLTDLTLSSF